MDAAQKRILDNLLKTIRQKADAVQEPSKVPHLVKALFIMDDDTVKVFDKGMFFGIKEHKTQKDDDSDYSLIGGIELDVKHIHAIREAILELEEVEQILIKEYIGI